MQTKTQIRRFAPAIVAAVAMLLHLPACGEVTSVRVARQYGIGYLQMMVMEHDRLIEKHAKALGLGELDITWSTFSNGAVANDAVISGDLDFVAGGLGSFLTLWDRTRDTLGVKGIAALDSMPMLLNTRNPRVRSIRDLTDEDRIAIPGVKVSSQATTLQLAAAQAFGDANWGALDHLTVTLGHPTAMQALVSGGSEITAHFTAPPFQYDELRHAGVRTVLNSYDVWGGPQTFILAWTTATFRARNPKVYRAFLAALTEATGWVNRHRQAAAGIYGRMTGQKRESVAELARMLEDPQIRFTLTPENVLKFAAFKVRIGAVKTMPASWRDLFFPEIHDLPGS
jgi:NitT/TauT family transport system substrate-binding protein